MRFLLFAFTPGPDAMLKLIAAALNAILHKAVVLKTGAPIENDAVDRVDECDALVLGGPDSAYPEHQRRLVERALSLGKPIIILEDIPGSSRRPWFKEYAPRVRQVLLAMPGEQWKQQSSDHGYPEVLHVALPPHWGVAYEAMTSGMSKEALRRSFQKYRGNVSMPLAAEDRVVFFNGIKNHPINTTIIRLMREAGERVLEDRFVMGFRPHPREPEDGAAVALREKLLQGVWLLETGEATQPQIIKSVDIPVFTGGATDSIVAAYARLIPAHYVDGTVVEYMEHEGGHKDGKWFVAELGGVYPIRSQEQFEPALRVLLSPEGQEELHRTQEANFPPPFPSSETARAIAKHLVVSLSKKNLSL